MPSQVPGQLLTPSVLAPFGSAGQTLISRDGAAASSKQAPGQLVPRVSCAIMFIRRILDDIHGAKQSSLVQNSHCNIIDIATIAV